MPYRIERSEGVPGEIARIVDEQIQRAVDELHAQGEQRHEAVHQARKRLKKIRGVLRLVRPALGGAYKQENAWYRDTAGALSQVRDAEAIIETLDKLHERYPEQSDDPGYAELRAALVERRRRIAEHEADLDARIQGALARLEQARERLDEWALDEDGFSVLAGGLGKTYTRGRKAMRRAYADPDDALFHDWRKRVKYHWYHARLLRELWPKMMNSYAGALKRLSDLLGDDHDLAVLREASAEISAGAQRAALLALCARRQDELRSEACSLGGRVYTEKPKRLLRRLDTYWRVWEQDQARG